MPENKVQVRSTWVDDGKGGQVLRAWVEGRLWPVEAVQSRPLIWDHAVGCPECDWQGAMIELCRPGLVLDGLTE